MISFGVESCFKIGYYIFYLNNPKVDGQLEFDVFKHKKFKACRYKCMTSNRILFISSTTVCSSYKEQQHKKELFKNRAVAGLNLFSNRN